MDEFKVTETLRHGFPHRPTCLAYDCVQQLLAIGSHNGSVLILGQRGLMRELHHPNTTVHIVCMAFGINKGLLVTVCSSGVMYLWSFVDQDPVIVDTLSMDRNCPTLLNWPFGSNWLYIGTQEGNTFFVKVEESDAEFKLILSEEDTIHWNKVAERSGSQRTLPGQLIAVCENPAEHCKLLLSFSGGLNVLWCNRTKDVDKRFSCDVKTRGTTLTAACWVSKNKFVAGYSDGTIVPFDVKSGRSKPPFKLTDGLRPNPANAPITKLHCANLKEKCLYYSGGHATSSANSCNSGALVSIFNLKKETCRQLESPDGRVIDFICLPTSPFKNDVQQPFALAVLTENKLAMVDVQCPELPKYPQPYSLHLDSSPVTSLVHCGDCSPDAEGRLYALKSKLKQHQPRETRTLWPLNGGVWDSRAKKIPSQLIVTGHLDGTVHFWLCYHDIFELAFSVCTGEYFHRSAGRKPNPTSDQEDLAVEMIKMSLEQQTLIVINAIGHVLLFSLEQESSSITVKSQEIVLHDSASEKMGVGYGIAPRSTDEWKFTAGWRRQTKEGEEEESSHRVQLLVHCCCYFQKGFTKQIISVGSAEYSSRMELLAVGTTQGLALVDTDRDDVIETITNSRQLLKMADPTFSGGFRRSGKEGKKFFQKVPKLFRSRKTADPGAASPEPEPEPDQDLDCYVTLLEIVYFMCNESPSQPLPTLWVGTSSGKFCAFRVSFKEGAAICSERLELSPTNMATEKTSPVVDALFLNDQLEEIPSHTPWSPRQPSPPNDRPGQSLNYVVLTTKEYIKSYGFPGKKKIGSYLLPKEDECIEKSSLYLPSSGKPLLLALVKTGQIVIHTLPELSCVARITRTPFTQISGHDNLSLTAAGQGVFIHSPTEIQRLAISPKGANEHSLYQPLLYTERVAPVVKRSSRIIVGSRSSRSLLQDRDHLFGASMSTLKRTQLTQSTPSIVTAGGAREEIDGGLTRSGWKGKKEDVSRGGRYKGGRQSLGETGTNGVATAGNTYQRTQQALHERGEALHRTQDATANMLSAAETYGDTMKLFREKYHLTESH